MPPKDLSRYGTVEKNPGWYDFDKLLIEILAYLTELTKGIPGFESILNYKATSANRTSFAFDNNFWANYVTFRNARIPINFITYKQMGESIMDHFSGMPAVTVNSAGGNVALAWGGIWGTTLRLTGGLGPKVDDGPAAAAFKDKSAEDFALVLQNLRVQNALVQAQTNFLAWFFTRDTQDASLIDPNLSDSTGSTAWRLVKMMMFRNSMNATCQIATLQNKTYCQYCTGTNTPAFPVGALPLFPTQNQPAGTALRLRLVLFSE
jgi:hypothetical protein